MYQDLTAKSSLDVVPLDEVIKTSGTLHGLSASDASNWAAAQDDSTTTTLALFGTGSLEALYRAVYFDKPPDFFLTSKTLAGIYSSKLLPTERRQPEGGRAGSPYSDLYFMGVPIYVDNKCPATNWYAGNFEFLKLVIHNGYNFNLEPFESDPDRYHAIRSFLSAQTQLICSKRRAFGRYTAITG